VEGSVDAIELKWLHGADDPADCGGVQRDQIWIAIHEADPAAIGHNLNDVPGQEDAAAPGTGGPVEHRAALKMAAAPNERDRIVRSTTGNQTRTDRGDRRTVQGTGLRIGATSGQTLIVTNHLALHLSWLEINCFYVLLAFDVKECI
jgi:hypothetical protein